MGNGGNVIGLLASGIALILLGAGTWTRAGVYKNEETLWRDNVAKNPAAEVAHYNLGLALKHRGRFQEAIGHFEQALQLKPDSADTHNNLGATLWQVGRAQEAMGHYELALRIKPDSAEAHYNLGLASAQAGRIEEAIDHWSRRCEANPTMLRRTTT